MKRLVSPFAVIAALALVATGCGGGSGDTTPTSEIAASRQLIVFADSSIRGPITVFGGAAGVEAANTFASSPDLADRIRNGEKADVYVAAGALPEQLFSEGLVGKPITFARGGGVTYSAAAVKAGEHAALGEQYVRTLVSPTGAQVMSEAGLQPAK